MPAIAGLEGFSAGTLRGALGWIDCPRGGGSSSSACAPRSSTARRARMYAGAGIVAGSSPRTSSPETELKFRAMQDALLGRISLSARTSMEPRVLDFSNVNSSGGASMAETLVRSGVARAVISPGSRSTPLAFAFARHPGIEAIPVLDERSACSSRSGLAKRTWARRAPVHERPAAADVFRRGRGEESGSRYRHHRRPAPRCATAPGPDDRPARPLRCLRPLSPRARRPGDERGATSLRAPDLRPRRGAGPRAPRWPRPSQPPFPTPGADGRRGDRRVRRRNRMEAFFCSVAGTGGARLRHPGIPHSVHGLIVSGPSPTRTGPVDSAAAGETPQEAGWPVLGGRPLARAQPCRGRSYLVTRYDAILRLHPVRPIRSGPKFRAAPGSGRRGRRRAPGSRPAGLRCSSPPSGRTTATRCTGPTRRWSSRCAPWRSASRRPTRRTATSGSGLRGAGPRLALWPPRGRGCRTQVWICFFTGPPIPIYYLENEIYTYDNARSYAIPLPATTTPSITPYFIASS